ncbi:MAG: hypothetical protein K8R24_12305 [Mycobacterium sp.]|jgi:hypothetical protein|nr:hypothetical protein [Mycobacterium sp.]
MSQVWTMTDLPPGEWSPLLVGHQWPTGATLSALAAAADRRAAAHTRHDSYADALQAIRTEHLGIQEGVAAEAARGLFRTGEEAARSIAAKNLGKRASYIAAQRAVSELRFDLQTIAEHGNAAIRKVLDSAAEPAAQVSAIVEIVADAQQQSNARAASRCADVLTAAQDVLSAEPAGHSVRYFALANGVGLPDAFGSPVSERIHAEVSAMMSNLKTAQDTSGCAPGDRDD